MAQASTFAIPNKTVLTAAALTALTGLAALNDGAKARVSSYENDFELITSAAAVVADEILASSDGSRRWFRIPVSSAKWASRSAWFVDPAGNNENDGASNVTPLKTNSELWRRLGYGADVIIRQITTFNFSGNFGVADPLILSLRLTGAGIYTKFVGTVTVTSGPSQVVAKTDLARPALPTMTGQPGIAALVGQRVTITSGAAAGASFWLERVVAGDQIETSNPIAAMPIPNTGVPAPTTIVAGAGNNYQTETLSRIDAMNVTIKCDDLAGPPNLNAAYFVDLDLQKAAALSGPTVDGGAAQIIFQGCGIGNLFGTAPAAVLYIFDNCSFRSINTGRGTNFFFAGMALGNFLMRFQETAWALFDMDFVCQQSRIESRRRGQVNFGTCCIQNATGVGFLLNTDACDTKNATNFAGAHLLYGTGSTGVGVSIGSGRGFFYVATKPTLTGAGGDTTIGSAAVTAYAAVPFVFNGATDNNAQMNVAFP